MSVSTSDLIALDMTADQRDVRRWYLDQKLFSLTNNKKAGNQQ
jgi:hypothetical protein